MYGVALSVSACVRAGTRVDVAWLVDPGPFEGHDATDAVALTPGGGRVGSLLAGALDGQLAELAGAAGSGRLLTLHVGKVDADVAGLAGEGDVRCLLLPADALPAGLWEPLLARVPVGIATRLDGDSVVSTELIDDPGGAGGGVELAGDTIVTILRPAPRLVVVGPGEIAEALVAAAALLGWRSEVVGNASAAAGMIATLAWIDAVVVAAHDVELAGAALAAALSGDAGYIGSVGGRRMQEVRADWLAYRDVTDLSRVHGPAGLAIGAESPPEIAVAILAEALAATRTVTRA